MNPFRFLTRAFIDVFGITHPTPQQERRATWFISIMLVLIVAGAAAVFLAGYHFSHR
jgi:hypothetical protein